MHARWKLIAEGKMKMQEKMLCKGSGKHVDKSKSTQYVSNNKKYVM